MRRVAASLRAALLALLVLCACSDSETHLARAETYKAEGKYKEALIELRSALKLDPQSAETNFQIAWTLLHLNRPVGAVFFFRETQRLDPSRTDAGK